MPRRKVDPRDKIASDIMVAIFRAQRIVQDIRLGLKVQMWHRILNVQKRVVTIPDSIIQRQWDRIVRPPEE